MKIKKRAADERKNRSEQCRAQASLPLRGTAPESWSTACGRGSQECLTPAVELWKPAIIEDTPSWLQNSKLAIT